MADDGVGVVFVFIYKLFRAWEGYLVDILVDVVGGHAYATVGDGECAGFFVDLDFDTHFAELTFVFAEWREGLELLGGVDGVGYKFAEKYLIVGIEEFFDDREYVFGRYSYLSFLHDYICGFVCVIRCLYNK